MNLSKITINNFRCFNRELSFDFGWRGLTVLTGPNNSGKSTLFKLITLLKDNFRHNIHHSSDFEYLVFKGKSRNLFGFKDILPNKDTSKILEITFPFAYGELRLFYIVNDADNDQGKLLGFRWFREVDEESSEKDEIIFLELEIKEEGYQANINFEAIKELIDDKRYEEKKREEPLRKFLGGKTIDERNNPKHKKYDPDQPIYDLELFSEKLGISDPDAATRRILNQVSSITDSFQEPDYHAPILTGFLEKIKKLYVPRNIRIENAEFTRDDKKRMESKENGYAFFQEVAKLIDDSFNSFFENLDSIRHINNDRIIENRVFLLNEDNVLNQSILNYISNPNLFDFKFLNECLKKFNVLKPDEKVRINHLSKSAAEIVFVNDNEKEPYGSRNLLDEGFGVVQLFTIFLCLSEISKDRTIFIEEPEINLHPNFQSLLAEVFVEYVSKGKNKLIIETHSEYIIRKLQYMVASNVLNNNFVKIFYFHGRNATSELIVDKIEIQRDGRLNKEFGTGFIDESTKIIFDIWNLPGQN